jgi:gentisate 1,2-dioxygenase
MVAEDSELARLYADFTAAHVMPLWTLREALMPTTPAPGARPYRWRGRDTFPLAERAGALVPVGRGGERRAIALANPGLPGLPYATPTLWAAIQYLGPGEVAPPHRHSQSAFRFVVEGEGVWTVVDGDAVAMRRGDLLLTAGGAWHGHTNHGDAPMVWLDGLDIPLVQSLDAGFFEFGSDAGAPSAGPRFSRSEALWAHPGLRPVASSDTATSPLVAYRWPETDAALAAQLALAADGHPGAVGPGHAAVRFSNPTTGRDALATLRTEMHRLQASTSTTRRRTAGSSVWQVFSGDGVFDLDGQTVDVTTSDVVAVPSWCSLRISANTDLDLFVFSDAPVLEALGLARSEPAGPAGLPG